MNGTDGLSTKTTKTGSAASRQQIRNVPANWGQSELSSFLDMTELQAHATYALMPDWVAALEAIDAALVVRSSEIFHEIDVPRQTSAWLFMRAFGTFRAAARLAISGQLFEETVLVRSIVESSVYAWACAHSPSHRSVWQRRRESKSRQQKAREAFAWGALMAMLKTSSPRLSDQIRSFYDHAIETGAHPNVDGVSLSCDTVEIGADKYAVSTIFMHGEEAVRIGVLELWNAMQLSFRLLQLTIPDRLSALGIDTLMADEKLRFAGTIEAFKREQQAER